MAPLKRSDVSGPGITRKGRGRGFQYSGPDGQPVRDLDTLARIRALVIPPAWRDVWISEHPRGHVQATGVDAAGRKQYRYHDDWRSRRDSEKFESMIEFARSLPTLRRRVADDLGGAPLGQAQVLACATRLLDRGFFRVGSEGYAEENETYGLATIRKDHVTVSDGIMVFDYNAKGSKRRVQRVDDEDVVDIVGTLKRRRGGGAELLAFKRGRRWIDVKSADINAYVKDASDGDFSAKDFRTWNATVLAAIALAVSGEAADGPKTARKRAAKRAVDEVARYLGNTPAVSKASYIDPRVFDRFDGGLTVGGVLPDLLDEDGGWPAIQPTL
ncbi:MAG: DNA topoisomerase IB, partial [Thermoleophilaceae bacterium]